MFIVTVIDSCSLTHYPQNLEHSEINNILISIYNGKYKSLYCHLVFTNSIYRKSAFNAILGGLLIILKNTNCKCNSLIVGNGHSHFVRSYRETKLLSLNNYALIPRRNILETVWWKSCLWTWNINILPIFWVRVKKKKIKLF